MQLPVKESSKHRGPEAEDVRSVQGGGEARVAAAM